MFLKLLGPTVSTFLAGLALSCVSAIRISLVPDDVTTEQRKGWSHTSFMFVCEQTRRVDREVEELS